MQCPLRATALPKGPTLNSRSRDSGALQTCPSLQPLLRVHPLQVLCAKHLRPAARTPSPIRARRRGMTINSRGRTSGAHRTCPDQPRPAASARLGTAMRARRRLAVRDRPSPVTALRSGTTMISRRTTRVHRAMHAKPRPAGVRRHRPLRMTMPGNGRGRTISRSRHRAAKSRPAGRNGNSSMNRRTSASGVRVPSSGIRNKGPSSNRRCVSCPIPPRPGRARTRRPAPRTRRCHDRGQSRSANLSRPRPAARRGGSRRALGTIIWLRLRTSSMMRWRR